jgi:predicted nuclease of predicted toxin-antitoxin system
MRVLIDMNLTPRWVGFLEESPSLQASHWSAVGRLDAPDAEIMRYAAEHECVVLTHDLDFSTILATTHASKPSVIQLRGGDVRPEALAALVKQALATCAEELKSGALLTIEADRSRIRLLPLMPQGLRP